MKKLLTLLLLANSISLIAAEQKSAPQSITGNSPSPAVSFNTDDEAIKSYLDKLISTKPVFSFEAIMPIFTQDPVFLEGLLKKINSKSKASSGSLGVISKEITASAGSFRSAEVTAIRKVGSEFRRVGYLLTYDHNLSFVDCWFAHRTDGKWQLCSTDFSLNSDFRTTLKEIPPALYSESVSALKSTSTMTR